MYKKLILLAAISVVVSGCFRVVTEIDVNNDNSATLSVVTAVDSEIVEEQAGGFLGGLDVCEQISSELTSPQAADQFEADGLDIAEVVEYDEDGFCGVQSTATVPASDNLAETLAATAAGNGVVDAQQIDLEKIADDEWTFSAEIAAADEAFDDLVADSPIQLPAGFEDSGEIIYSISLPGAESDNNANATSTEDGKTTFTWDLSINASEIQLNAATTPTAGGLAGLSAWAFLIAGLVVVAAVLGGLFLLRRNSAEPAIAGLGYQPSDGPAPFTSFDSTATAGAPNPITQTAASDPIAGGNKTGDVAGPPLLKDQENVPEAPPVRGNSDNDESAVPPDENPEQIDPT